MWTAIWLLVGASAAWITWRIQTDPRRRKERLLKQIVKMEERLRHALVKEDATMVANLNAELEQLRRKANLLGG